MRQTWKTLGLVLGALGGGWACAAPQAQGTLESPPAAWVEAQARLAAGDRPGALPLASLAAQASTAWQTQWALAQALEGGEAEAWRSACQAAEGAMAAAQGPPLPDGESSPAWQAQWGQKPGAQGLVAVNLAWGRAATAAGIAQAKLGQKHEAKLRYQEALEAYQRALQWQPGHPQAMAGVAGLKATLSFMLDA